MHASAHGAPKSSCGSCMDPARPPGAHSRRCFAPSESDARKHAHRKHVTDRSIHRSTAGRLTTTDIQIQAPRPRPRALASPSLAGSHSHPIGEAKPQRQRMVDQSFVLMGAAHPSVRPSPNRAAGDEPMQKAIRSIGRGGAARRAFKARRPTHSAQHKVAGRARSGSVRTELGRQSVRGEVGTARARRVGAEAGARRPDVPM